MLDQFPGRLITVELPKLPRPEIGKVMPSRIFGRQTVFHPVMEPTKETMPKLEIIKRIQRHVLEHRIRIHEFFKVILINHAFYGLISIIINKMSYARDALSRTMIGFDVVASLYFILRMRYGIVIAYLQLGPKRFNFP